MIVSPSDATTDVLDIPVGKRTLSIFDQLAGWQKCEVEHHKPPVSNVALVHRQFSQDEFWRHIPAYRDVDTETFLDHAWQSRNSITTPARLQKLVADLVAPELISDLDAGLRRAPMSIRISPYILALVDWSDPYRCPLRTQFVPLGSQSCEDHPQLHLDALHEQERASLPLR